MSFLVVQRGKTTIKILYETLRIELEPAMLNFCRASLNKHAGESVYSVAIYTSPLYEYVVGSISTKQRLEQAARGYLSKRDYQEQWKTLEIAMRNLKWFPCDSSYLGEFDDLFSKATAILGDIWEPLDIHDDRTTEDAYSNIHRVFIAVLAAVRDSGLFDTTRVVFNILIGDQSEEEMLLNAEAVNSQETIRWFREELEIDSSRLELIRTNRWT